MVRRTKERSVKGWKTGKEGRTMERSVGGIEVRWVVKRR